MKSEKLLFVLKILAVFLIPSMYTITYLAANNDPYGNMDQVPVAIINKDEGYEYSGVNVNIGREIAAGLVESNAFDFGIIEENDFNYEDYFMKITIPENMSESILNPISNNYQQVQIDMTIDESKNYIFASIAGEALYQMEAEINNQIEEQYLSVGLNVIEEMIGAYNDKNTKISDKVYEINDDIDNSQNELNNIMSNIDQDISSAQDDVEEIQASLNDGISSIDASKENIISQLDEIQTTVNEQIATLNDSFDISEEYSSNIVDNLQTNSDKIFNDIRTTVDENYDSVSTKITDLTTDLDTKTDETLNNIDERINEINSTMSTASSNIDDLQTDVLNNENLYNELSIEGNINDIINFFATPVHFESDRQNAVNTYGQGLAPYFVSLSLYVGALILLTVLPYDELKKQLYKLNHTKRLVFYLGFSVFQVLILFMLLTYVNDFSFINPLIFIIYSIFVSLTFISLILLLVLILRDIGKFLAFILLVLQLGGSAGTFPIETSPEFFKIINPFLPMTYTVNKYREILFLEDVSIIKSIIFMSAFVILVFVILVIYLKKHERELPKVYKIIQMDEER